MQSFKDWKINTILNYFLFSLSNQMRTEISINYNFVLKKEDNLGLLNFISSYFMIIEQTYKFLMEVQKQKLLILGSEPPSHTEND